MARAGPKDAPTPGSGALTILAHQSSEEGLHAQNEHQNSAWTVPDDPIARPKPGGQEKSPVTEGASVYHTAVTLWPLPAWVDNYRQWKIQWGGRWKETHTP